ncbi:MFS transporter [Oceanomicrobium pacificus]|uniref:MFS transporter n=1 Tax=Oceanomicrobium pacificus TaxID=2692916 RepID=A0A6B0U4Z6_9RHOB|nr:MFS transporter [Oceanomicrobium pacificus]MXU66001.1 MFS transporter [Oceanomicrobium pacificus]
MSRWIVLITLALSTFIIVVDTTVMNVSISALIVDLDTTVGGIQAAIALYALVMASFMLIGGKLADILGKKRVFMIGVCVFGVGTFLASTSQSLWMLIIGWSVIEGIGSALMMPNIQTILRDSYDGAERAFAYGIISAVAAVGAAVGPIVGGFLTTYYTWRWAFRIEVLIVILVLILCRAIAADAKREDRPSFDFAGAILSVCGWSLIVLAVLLGQTYGFVMARQPFMLGDVAINPFGLSIVPVLVAIGLASLVALFTLERRRESAGRPGLFRPSLLSAPGLLPGISARFIQMAIMAAFLFTMPLLFQLAFAFSAMETGLALIPFSLALLVCAILGARLSSRYSADRIIRAGFVLAVLGLLIIGGTIRPDAEPEDLATGVVFGAGLGLIASQILNLVLSSVAPEQTAEASGLNGTFEQLGNAIGVALVGTMMIAGLTAALSSQIMALPGLDAAQQSVVIATLEQSVELVSDAQITAGLDAAGIAPEAQSDILSGYAQARTQAFRTGIWFLTLLGLIGLALSFKLPKRKLV